jgi:hypothetical protein
MCRSLAMRPASARIVGVLVALTTFGLGGGIGVSPASAGVAAAAAALSAPQGGTITISGNVSVSAACPASTPLQVTSMQTTGDTNLFANGLGPQVTRAANGDFKTTLAIPASTPVGSYIIGLRCGPTVVGTNETLTVTAGAQAKPSLLVAPTSAQPGDSVTISGLVPTSGAVFCPAGDAIRLTATAALFPPDGFGPQVTRDAAGKFQVAYKVPATTAAGKYGIGVRCGGGNLVVTTSLQVTATAATTTTAPTTTTTSTVPAETTTSGPTTTFVPATTVPGTTTTLAPAVKAKSTHKNSPWRWAALGAFVLVVLAVGGTILRRGRGAATPAG